MKKQILIIILPTLLYANFIGMNNGARSLGMGNAFVALSDEATAIFYNPAGLARTNKLNLIASHQELYGISDLYSDMLAISFPTPLFRTGVAVQQINLVDTYSEQIFYLSGAGIIKVKSIPIRFGASLKYESAKVKNYENAKNSSSIDFDFGILADINENLFLGYSARYLLEPTFQFIESEDSIEREYALGLCYNWRSSVNFLADHIFGVGVSKWNFGSEIWFYDVFAARIKSTNVQAFLETAFSALTGL